MSHRLKPALIISLAFNLGFVIMFALPWLHRPDGPRPPRREFPPPDMRRDLGLSAEQATRLRELEAQLHAAMEPLRRDGDALRRELEEAVANGESEKAVEERIEAMLEVQRQMLQRMVEHERGLRGVLSAEQRQRFRGFGRAGGPGGPPDGGRGPRGPRDGGPGGPMPPGPGGPGGPGQGRR